jgi:hypothetical protein
VESFTLPVGTFHGIRLREVYPFGYPAFCAIGKRGGFYKFPANPEFPAMDTESAVFGWFLFIRKTLYRAFGYRQDSIIVVSHPSFPSLLY